MFRFIRQSVAVASFAASTFITTTAFAADVSVMDAYARAMPSANLNSAAFMKLHNNGAESVELVGAESNVAKHVELHTHTHVDGVMQMRQVESISLPAKGMAMLKPGDNHIMLIDLNGPLAEGDQIDLTLKWSDDTEQTIKVPVKFAMPNDSSQKEMKHEHSMEKEAHAH
jgi:copper(I)-binding protein